MLNLLEALYVVAALALLAAIATWLRKRPDDPVLEARRRRSVRVLMTVAAATAALAAWLYQVLTPHR
jgi:hypothetical protein